MSDTVESRSPSTAASSKGHVVIVGAGPGIGLAVAERFGRQGYRVSLVARRPDALEELAAPLRAAGAEVATFVADAGDPERLQHAVERAVADQPATVLVHNVALLQQDSLLSSSIDHLQRAYAIDVLALAVAVRAALPGFRVGGGGTVLVTGGSLADQPHAPMASLSLGKAAVRAAAVVLGQELADDAVHVATITISGSVAPGTPFDPARIADVYWDLHVEPRSAWRTEVQFDGN